MENYKKKYEEKLKLARNRYYDLSITDEEKNFLEKLFPILKESRDERIRLSIIKLVKQHSVNHERCQMENWLNEQRKTDEAYQRGFNEGVRITLEKQESEDTKPKFKVGEWVVYDNNIVCHIDRIYQGENSLMYTITDADNRVCSYSIESFDIISHLWTIQDAKAGDVLAGHESYVIFKEIDGLNIKCYCTYHYMGSNPSLYVDTLQNKTAYYPATQEQRDTLMKAIAGAGYTFDFEKKELKKIEQKPAEYSEEDELSCFESALFTAFSYAWQSYLLGEKVNIKQWAKEQSKDLLEAAKEELKCTNLAWSREDEYIIERLFCLLNNEQDNYPQLSSDFQEIEEIKNKLKSIKERYTWKPSEEHLHWLKWAINRMPDTEKANEARAVLEELLEQLKKLREE